MTTDSTTKFNFDIDFQVKILALILKQKMFLESVVNYLKPHYFENKELTWYYNIIVNYFKEYKTLPTLLILKQKLKNHLLKIDSRQERQVYLDILSELQKPIDEERYIIDEVITFCRREEVKNITLYSVEKIFTNPSDQLWQDIEAKMKEACNIGLKDFDVGINYFGTYKERIEERQKVDVSRRYSTGVQQLDEYLGGGLKKKQIFIMIAGTGGGKSLYLAHVCKHLASEGLKGVYYTFELADVDIAERLDASYCSIPLMEIPLRPNEVISSLDTIAVKYTNNIYIKEYPMRGASVHTIKAHLNQLKLQGFVPDFICVDYLDLVKPTTSYSSMYEDLGVVTQELRGLASELGIAVFTATQANREGNVNELIDIDNVSDSIQKMFVADVVASICRTNEEVEANRARLFLIKNRNGPVKVIVPIATDYRCARFFVPQASSLSLEPSLNIKKLEVKNYNE